MSPRLLLSLNIFVQHFPRDPGLLCGDEKGQGSRQSPVVRRTTTLTREKLEDSRQTPRRRRRRSRRRRRGLPPGLSQRDVLYDLMFWRIRKHLSFEIITFLLSSRALVKEGFIFLLHLRQSILYKGIERDQRNRKRHMKNLSKRTRARAPRSIARPLGPANMHTLPARARASERASERALIRGCGDGSSVCFVSAWRMQQHLQCSELSSRRSFNFIVPCRVPRLCLLSQLFLD